MTLATKNVAFRLHSDPERCLKNLHYILKSVKVHLNVSWKSVGISVFPWHDCTAVYQNELEVLALFYMLSCKTFFFSISLSQISSYILRRPQNFARSPPNIWLAVHRTNNWWWFHKIVLWTLTDHNLNSFDFLCCIIRCVVLAYLQY